MAELTIQTTGVTDTRINANATTTNYGNGVTLLIGEENGGDEIDRTLMKFVLTDIPAGATISSAVLTLTYNATDYSVNDRTLRVYRVLRAWTEGNGSAGSGADWATYDGSNNWGTAGCANTTTDREATDIGSGTQVNNPSDGGTVVINLTASKIEEMITGGGFTNNGFLLKVDTEADDMVGYYATNDPVSATRPKLVVTYTSESASISATPSASPSASQSATPSVSKSASLSASISSTPSTSVSASPSSTPSASPSPGYTGYTRGDEAALPANDADLETNYSAGDVTDVSSKNDVRVAQTATQQYMLHQFKNFVSTNPSCQLEWEGQTTLDPALSTVYLQIYNRDTTTWDTVDSDNTSAIDTDFILTGEVADLTNYRDSRNVVSCRVYQEAL